MDIALVIAFGAVTLVAGFALYWISWDHHLSPYLALREIIINWRELLNQGPGTMPVVNAHALGYKALVKHFHGYYWVDERPVTGSAGRVYVYPDFIARLHYVNRWEHSRLLDASAFSLRVGEMGDTASAQKAVSGTPEADSNSGWSVVDFLCRGVRWQLTFDDSSIKSLDKYVMNCHLAVHTTVELPLSDTDRLNRLFDIRPQFEQVLRSVISGALRDELSKRRYREAMYAVPDIIARLNRDWAERPEFRDYHDLIQVQFTALVIRPREEAERQFITADVNLASVKEKIRRLDRELEENRETRHRRWEELMCKQELAMKALHKRVGSSITQAANALGVQMKSIGDAQVAPRFRRRTL